MSNIYILGNPLLEEDSLPSSILPKLKSSFPNHNFSHLDTTEDLPEEDHLIIIDTILNSSSISILTEKDIDKISSSPNYSLHDLDLATNLKIMKKLGTLKKLKIIGLPPNMKEDEAIKKINNYLNGEKLSLQKR